MTIFLAAVACAGCFTVPSSYRLQHTGRPRPEALIGSSKAIDLGQTSIVAAAVAVSRQTGDTTFEVSSDAHSIAFRYLLDTGTRVIPFIDVYADQQDRWLILDTDQTDHVRAARTVDKLPSSEFNFFWPRDDRLTTHLTPVERDELVRERILLTQAQYDAIDQLRLRICCAMH